METPKEIGIDTYAYPTDVKVLDLGMKTGYDYAVPHRHEYYEVFLITGAGGYHDIDFTRHEIKTSSLHVVAPRRLHCLNRGIGTHGNVLLFRSDLLQKVGVNSFKYLSLALHNSSPIIEVSPKEEVEIQNYLNFFRQLEEQGAHSRELGCVLEAFCEKIELMFKYKLDSATKRDDYELNQLKAFCDLVEGNYISEVKVSFYADALNISTFSLNRLLKDHISATASKYILNRRLLEMKRILAISNMTFTELANHMGFNDTSHMRKFVKSSTGLSIKELKEQARVEESLV